MLRSCNFITLLRRLNNNNVTLQKAVGGPSRTTTTTSTGEILPRPKRVKFGLLGVICTIIPSLLLGATISKKMANFLEENELFVPSDDDDDDD